MTSEYLLRRELEHVLAALTPANALVARVCVDTGLRVGDVVGLRTDQLGPQFWVTERKTGKRRRVNLRKPLLEALRAQAGPVYVFQHRTRKDRHRSRQAVWRDIKRAAVAFRLPQNVTPHSLRKLYAVEQLEKGRGDLERVQRLLNHADQGTTLLYAMARQLYEAKYPGRR